MTSSSKTLPIDNLSHEGCITPSPSTVKIIPATTRHLQQINDIYNYYVQTSTCTYQLTDETMEARLAWWNNHSPQHPVFVVIDSTDPEKVLGWASINKFHVREGYSQTVDESIFIDHRHQGKRIGTLLLSHIISTARELKYHTLMAGIDSQQTASQNLHIAHGFKLVGRYSQVGYKFDKWLDCLWFQLML